MGMGELQAAWINNWSGADCMHGCVSVCGGDVCVYRLRYISLARPCNVMALAVTVKTKARLGSACSSKRGCMAWNVSGQFLPQRHTTTTTLSRTSPRRHPLTATALHSKPHQQQTATQPTSPARCPAGVSAPHAMHKQNAPCNLAPHAVVLNASQAGFSVGYLRRRCRLGAELRIPLLIA